MSMSDVTRTRFTRKRNATPMRVPRTRLCSEAGQAQIAATRRAASKRPVHCPITAPRKPPTVSNVPARSAGMPTALSPWATTEAMTRDRGAAPRSSRTKTRRNRPRASAEKRAQNHVMERGGGPDPDGAGAG